VRLLSQSRALVPVGPAASRLTSVDKFSIGSKRWSMNSRMPSATNGSYVVEVVLGEKKLGDVSFVVE
jgi:hypothetical protein